MHCQAARSVGSFSRACSVVVDLANYERSEELYCKIILLYIWGESWAELSYVLLQIPYMIMDQRLIRTTLILLRATSRTTRLLSHQCYSRLEDDHDELDRTKVILGSHVWKWEIDQYSSYSTHISSTLGRPRWAHVRTDAHYSLYK